MRRSLRGPLEKGARIRASPPRKGRKVSPENTLRRQIAAQSPVASISGVPSATASPSVTAARASRCEAMGSVISR